MSIDSLYTTQVSEAANVKTAGTATRSNGLQLQGLDFMDIILARIEADGQDLQPDTTLTDENPKFDLAKIIADNPDLAKERESFSLDQQSALSETLVLNQEAFGEILKAAKDGTIIVQGLGAEAENRTDFPKILESLLIDGEPSDDDNNGLSKARKILAAIERLLANEEGSSGFIAANLTPERIASIRSYYTRIQNIIADNASSPESIDEQPISGIFAGLIAIVPAQNRSAAPTTLISSEGQEGQAKSSGEILSRLNNLINTAPAGENALAGDERSLRGLPERNVDGDFGKTLKQASNQNNAKAENNNGNNAASNAPQVKPDLSVLLPWAPSLTGSLSATGEWATELGLAGTVANITDTANFTQLVTQASHASRAHPAAQLVAATIQKSMGAGGSKNVTLQLDPPELGKVEVSMEFGKDKSVKITVLSEKPETHLMLQRDAQSLERALANSGLDVEGGMSFELASQDHDFDHNGNNDGRDGNGSGQNGENGEDTEIIETTMTWQVDPETGHMRYNLMV